MKKFTMTKKEKERKTVSNKMCLCCEIDWEECTTFGIKWFYFFILWENCHRCSHVSFVAEQQRQQQTIFASLSKTQPTNCSSKPQCHLLFYYDVVNVSIFFLIHNSFSFCEFLCRLRWENEREIRSLSSHNEKSTRKILSQTNRLCLLKVSC